jgi:hypothetical protein
MGRTSTRVPVPNPGLISDSGTARLDFDAPESLPAVRSICIETHGVECEMTVHRALEPYSYRTGRTAGIHDLSGHTRGPWRCESSEISSVNQDGRANRP